MRNIIFTSLLGWVLTAFAANSEVCISGDIETPTNSDSNWTRGFVESGRVVTYEVQTAWEAENFPVNVTAFVIESCEDR